MKDIIKKQEELLKYKTELIDLVFSVPYDNWRAYKRGADIQWYKSRIKQLESELSVMKSKMEIEDHYSDKEVYKRLGGIESKMEEVTDQDIQNMQGFINSVKRITEDTPELNMCNYDHEQVRILNEALLEIYSLSHQFKETDKYLRSN